MSEKKPVQCILRKQRGLMAIAFAIVFTLPLQGQVQNAVIPGDFADPSIIRVGSEFYATGTSSEWAPHFPVFKSTDMIHWTQSGYVFDKTPAWTASSFWAPEYFYHKGTYFIYYAAKRKSDGISCVGVASSKFPDHEFRDHGVIIEFGKEAIDPFVFNDRGQLYITWKAYGLDKRPIELLGSRLSDDGLSLVGNTFSLLKDDPHIGIEGQSMLYRDGYYYLFYSAGSCCGIKCDYNTRVARSSSLLGPYELNPANPILSANSAWKCTGHGTFVQAADDRSYYLYHGYDIQSNVFTGRQALLAELTWPEKKSWPVFREVAANTDYSAAQRVNNLHNDFTRNRITPAWQWDFRHVVPVIRQQKDGLHLSGTIQPGNYSGAVLTLRPYAGLYTITTTVINHNAALKGLVIYGDANAAAGIGTTGDKVEFWIVKNNKRSVLGSANLENVSGNVDLKMTLLEGSNCKVYWKQKGDWQEVPPAGEPLKVGYLPQWDRSPRPGLCFNGEPTMDAVFSSFNLDYR